MSEQSTWFDYGNGSCEPPNEGLARVFRAAANFWCLTERVLTPMEVSSDLIELEDYVSYIQGRKQKEQRIDDALVAALDVEWASRDS